ncbi:hypothetical protein CPT_Sansa101 [Caulobacter phage Sansa]|uniref:Uncharacterized protein n=1 Tax=Caulobacter phage Sansa TaxID=1675600 RepID=A0A0K1LN00_9CAUD|nr:hypothetical protein HOR07_gp101 [Caulobacter phage Sansa]AKU43505.1 hypothetical protein CPT_Sansa101 [Caulobacter phage Sansa]
MSDELLPAAKMPALESLCHGTWSGTDALVASLVLESRGAPAWRPVRAAVVAATSDVENRIWMTPEEFADWVQGAKALAMRLGRGTTHPYQDLQIAPLRVKKLKNPKLMAAEGLIIKKGEALACAHYLMNFPKPVDNGDVEGFADWFDRRLKSVNLIAPYLNMGADTLGSRLRGYDVVRDQRVERKPEGWLIRALDWIDRMGPICPYGPRPAPPIFPGQKV